MGEYAKKRLAELKPAKKTWPRGRPSPHWCGKCGGRVGGWFCERVCGKPTGHDTTVGGGADGG